MRSKRFTTARASSHSRLRGENDEGPVKRLRAFDQPYRAMEGYLLDSAHGLLSRMWPHDDSYRDILLICLEDEGLDEVGG